MKLHRVLLFTTLQMDITPVGKDLHVLITNDGIPFIGCAAYAKPVPDSDPISCETSVLSNVETPDDLFCRYIAETLAANTGKNVLCTGGIFVNEPTEHEVEKLYENIDDMIKDWVTFYV